MATTASLLTTLVVLGMMAAPGFPGEDLGAYLVDKDGRKALKEPLTLRVTQDGIAGKTGTVWTIETSGKWRVSRLNTKDGQEHLTSIRTGIMTAAELESLAKTLHAQKLTEIPAKTGTEPKVNAHTVTLRFGERTASLAGLSSRKSPTLAEHIRKSAATKPEAEARVWERFAEVAKAVETLCPTSVKP
jgi:hypothetical protein